MSGYTARKIEINDDLWKVVSVTAASLGKSKKQVVEDALKKQLLHPAIQKRNTDQEVSRGGE